MTEKIYIAIFILKYSIGFDAPWSFSSFYVWRRGYHHFNQSIPTCKCCAPRGEMFFYRRYGFWFEIEYPITASVTA